VNEAVETYLTNPAVQRPHMPRERHPRGIKIYLSVAELDHPLLEKPAPDQCPFRITLSRSRFGDGSVMTRVDVTALNARGTELALEWEVVVA